ncbi:MAG: anti-sigma factor [Albidovulum sp.]
MTTSDDHMSERDALAAEYVLGTLPFADRQAAEALIDADPGFSQAVAEWQTRLAPLDDAYEEVPAPRAILDRAEERLFPRQTQKRMNWLAALIGGLAMATAVFLAVAYLPGLTGQGDVVATLTGENQPLTVTAAYAGASGKLTVTRSAGPAAETGKDYELWIIPEGQSAISLGLLRDQELVADISSLPPGTTLAITLEPTGGAPGGVATGPILVAAVIEK